MFKFLKEKLKSAISKISEGVEKEGKVEEKIVEKPIEEKGFFVRIKEKFVGKEVVEEKKNIILATKISEYKKIKPQEIEEIKHEKKIIKFTVPWTTSRSVVPINEHHIGGGTWYMPQDVGSTEEFLKKEYKFLIWEGDSEEIKKQKEELFQQIHKKIQKIPDKKEEHEKKGFFETVKEKIITTKIDEGQFEKLFWELELALMENNVAVEVIGKIKNDLKEELVEKPLKRTKVEETIEESLKNSIKELFQDKSIDLIQEIKNKKEKPYVIAFFGINGSGKTTSIAKIASMLKDKKISCVLAASDTFRAASIEQLQQHADKIGVKVIKHNYGADPAAVAFDAIKHAKAKNLDAVLIDTAGRMHSNTNLINELKKITRVAKPDLKIFVGESIAGNDCVNQAQEFNYAVGIDGIILAKADVDEKGGAAVSVSYVTKKPILFLGTGQKYGDLEPFSWERVMRSIGLV